MKVAYILNTSGQTVANKLGKIQLKNVVEGVHAGCFPDVYKALAGNPPDMVISL